MSLAARCICAGSFQPAALPVYLMGTAQLFSLAQKCNTVENKHAGITMADALPCCCQFQLQGYSLVT
jgi:hypothetical protein